MTSSGGQGARARLAEVPSPHERTGHDPSPRPQEAAPPALRVNLGCGRAYMDGWINVDSSPDVHADVHMDALDFVRRHGTECAELYMGHLLEHMLPGQALSLLRLIRARLPHGARISAVCPDIRAVLTAYALGDIDNRTLNERYVSSYEQPGPYVWCHDATSLAGLFTDAGLADVEPIDPLTWAPVFNKDGAESLYQCGVVGTIPARRAAGPAENGVVPTTPAPPAPAQPVRASQAPMTAEEQLLERLARARERLDRVEASLREVTLERELGERHAADLRRRLDALEGSRTVSVARRVATLAVPQGSRRRHLVDAAYGRVAGSRRARGG